MSSHNVSFYGELEKIISELSSNTIPEQILPDGAKNNVLSFYIPEVIVQTLYKQPT